MNEERFERELEAARADLALARAQRAELSKRYDTILERIATLCQELNGDHTGCSCCEDYSDAPVISWREYIGEDAYEAFKRQNPDISLGTSTRDTTSGPQNEP